MSVYNTIAENPNSTVVAEYVSVEPRLHEYQSERQLEDEFIRILQANGYEYLKIRNNKDLLVNLRNQISLLNNITFSDSEWNQILNNYLANKNDKIKEKTEKIQDNHIYALRRDDGTTKNIYILDKVDIHNNSLQVINQYEAEGTRENHYDVTVLVNGLPLIHVELKRRGVSIRDAFNQINRYHRESFFAASGLFQYIQLFVISNGTNTKYYSNTTRIESIKEHSGKPSGKKTNNSFEFTSWWTDAKNERIADLVDFAKTFFPKHTLLSMLIRYCVFTVEKKLMAMRPYQIAAAERILNKITMATNHKQLGTIYAGGYIWHTTGSGKTLTSFKTAQLVSSLGFINKVIFVVDRKDLDYQTMREYDKFKKGAANSNTTTAILTTQLGDPEAKIIITTIQKLARFIDSKKSHKVFDEHVVLIFDECHRSQFGEMHTKITKTFKNYHIFGFTGTPIFTDNSSSGRNPRLKTTEQAFGQQLHLYTIMNAIKDENVLPFKVEHCNIIRMKDDIKDKKVLGINIEKAFNAPQRITEITKYIIEHFNDKTKRNARHYYINKLINIKEVLADKKRNINTEIKEEKEETKVTGFNSIFAVSSIEAAKLYYNEFKSQGSDLKIATIFSFAANEEDEDGILVDEDFDTSNLNQSSKEFLDNAIGDYNKYFGTNYDISSAKNFENYYRDISLRMKDREIDLLIVVNMFLTGFDATTLNTLWVDKNLRHHGLLQAFSRTNRILNSVKTFGHIICFRDLEKATNDALKIFGNEKASGIVLLKSYEEYYNGWDKDGVNQRGYKDIIAEIQERFPLPVSIEGEQLEKDFIKLWGAILRLRNILFSCDKFKGNEILSEREFQDYQSAYLDLYDKLRKNKNADKEIINDDLIFEIELIKQFTINIDYIKQLLTEYQASPNQDKEILITIEKEMNSSIDLRSKRGLIENFIKTLNANADIDKDWGVFVKENKEKELESIIEEENLNREKTRDFIANAFSSGELKSTGTAFPKILPPISMFSPDNALGKKKLLVLKRLQMFYEKYFGI